MRLQRSRHCPVPGHGTRCVVARELEADRYPRTTEERLALEVELAADEPEREEGHPEERPGRISAPRARRRR